MIKSANEHSISSLLNVEQKVVYEIPLYQREYTWGKNEWETLFDDLDENKSGYFLGSVICINHSGDALATQRLELVDGQQRFTTVALLLASIYNILASHRTDLDDDGLNKLYNLKQKLVLGKDEIRLNLQIQGNNRYDYLAVLSEINLISGHNRPPYAGNRLIFRAHRYFNGRIEEMANDRDCGLEKVMGFLEKVNSACLVKIEVDSYADAYTLFESLNNRGVPLTPIDLIKNRLLSKLAANPENEQRLIDRYYQQWGCLLNDLEDDYTIQERFFRHYYNAFRHQLEGINNPATVATRSNLIKIYIELIEHNPEACLQDIVDAGKTYSEILCDNQNYTHDEDELGKLFKDLREIQGAPSYVLLLYLLSKKSDLGLTEDNLKSIVRLIVHFFVRRNLTDKPPTRDLNRLFMNLIDNINGHHSDAIFQLIEKKLVDVSAEDDEFIDKLKGPIYNENKGVTRFILNKLAEWGMTRETWSNVWDTGVWTIEHIFPQGDNIPEDWVMMIADGDVKLAKEIQQTHVHILGNLTITGYNSNLGAMSFTEKRDRRDRSGNFIGYKNNLALNEDLVEVDHWGVEQIDSRTEKLVDLATSLFSLE